MNKRLGIFLLSFVILLVSCLPMTVMAAAVGTCGFYNIGTADNIKVVPLRNGEPADILAVYANGDEVADLLYDYSNGLCVTVDKTVAGKVYAATLVKGSGLPETEADFLYTKQIVAAAKQVVFTVVPTPIFSSMDLTLFITSNNEDFESIAIPIGYAMENMYQVASGYPLPGTVTLSGKTELTATIQGAPSSEHYDIVWLRNGQVIEGATGTTYTPTPADQNTTIKVKLVAKGDIFTGEVVCARGIPISSGGGGGGGGDVPMYGINLDCGANGTATLSTKNAMANRNVSVTVKANEGFVVSTVTVTDAKGNAVEVTAEGDVYTFVMPKSAVSIKVTFIDEAEVKPEEPKEEEPEEVETVSFADVADDSFYYDAVLWAVKNNITQGISETSFAPDAACTRAQIITFLWRAAGEPKAENAENVFTDVAEGSYYYDAVLWAVEKGITAGTTETTFSPDATVDRAQTVTFMYRMAGEPAPATSDAFTDVAPTSYYNNAVNWAVTNGITNGTGVGTFSPQDACTRGQIVTFMFRYLAK